MAKEISRDILSLLSESDIRILIKSFDLREMLEPFKKNSKTYAKYISRLGRLDTKSVMLKKNLPNVVYELYKKNDINICALISLNANKSKRILLEALEENHIKLDYFKENSAPQIVETLITLGGKEESSIDIDLFFVQLKMNKVVIEDTKIVQIKEEWQKHIELVILEKRIKKEIEDAVRKSKNSYEIQLKERKKEYESKLLKIEVAKKDLEIDNNKKAEIIIKLDQKVKEVEYNLVEMKEKILKKENELTKKSAELLISNKELKKYKEIAIDKEIIFKREWEKQIIDEKKQLIEEREQLKKDIQEMMKKINQLSDEITKKSESPVEIKEEILLCSNEINSKKIRVDEMAITQEKKNIKIDDFYPKLSGIALYVKCGVKSATSKIITSLEEYRISVETNLEQSGCNMWNGDLEDFFNAAIGVGLVPLLCGYGTRKVAMGLIAARYGEIPTIISIPVGYNSINMLIKEVDNAETEVVVIEDLFGKMNEEIILPVLRMNTEKQLIFCCESLESMKYVGKYFYNYIQLLPIKKISNKKIKPLVFSNARRIFEDTEISEKSDIAKKVKRILRDIDISDTYIQSRKDLLTYAMEIMQRNEEETLKTWFENELKFILDNDQKEKVQKNLKSSCISISNDLIGIL